MRSASTERTLRILEFLTTHPGRGFTLSELSRRLRISKGTTHAIVSTLAERGALIRSGDSLEYRLGPALVPIGSIAERSVPALGHAKSEAERLAEEFDAECLLVMATGGELLIVGRAGVPGPLSITLREGQRRPLAPPLGAIVIAWMGDDAVDAWLDQLDRELTAVERLRYREAITAIRDRGYAVAIRGPRLTEFHRKVCDADLHSPEGRLEIMHALADIAHDDDYLPATIDSLAPDADLSSVAAPVFAHDGAMLFSIALLPDRQKARDIPDLARAVMRAAARVMSATERAEPVAPRASRER